MVCFHIEYNQIDALKSCDCLVKSTAKEPREGPVWSIYSTTHSYCLLKTCLPSFSHNFTLLSNIHRLSPLLCLSLTLHEIPSSHIPISNGSSLPSMCSDDIILMLPYYPVAFFCTPCPFLFWINHLSTHMKLPILYNVGYYLSLLEYRSTKEHTLR